METVLDGTALRNRASVIRIGLATISVAVSIFVPVSCFSAEVYQQPEEQCKAPDLDDDAIIRIVRVELLKRGKYINAGISEINIDRKDCLVLVEVVLEPSIVGGWLYFEIDEKGLIANEIRGH